MARERGGTMLLVLFIIFQLMIMGAYYKTNKVPNESIIISFITFFGYFFFMDPATMWSRLLLVICVFLASVFFLQFLGIGAGALKLVIISALVLGWQLSILYILLLTVVVFTMNKQKKGFRHFPFIVSLLALIVFIPFELLT
jgi:hypothetical protein